MPAVEQPGPPYLQIFRFYRDKITAGELRDGDPVPSIRAICEAWSIARATASRVVAALQSEGLIESRPGVGSFVSTSRIAPTAQEWATNVRRRGKIYPTTMHAHIVEAILISADQQVAEAVRLDPGVLVIRRQRITYDGATPVSLSTSWLPGELADPAPALLQTERLTQGTLGYLEDQTGRVATEGIDQYASRAATAAEAEVFGIEAGAPVQASRNWWLDAEGNVLEYGEGVQVADRWRTHRYHITLDDAGSA